MCTRSAERTVTRHVSLFAAFNYVETFQHLSHPHHSTLIFNTPLQWFNIHSTLSFNTIVNGLSKVGMDRLSLETTTTRNKIFGSDFFAATFKLLIKIYI
ncbi:hypothetical protein QL285_031039 [Trifolium repens]|nr:hypothetical protein QL285_031039 [Trifolium repens]